ncbi:uncharacterized protein HaLaN_32298, partial [Haematococcus lacustris]
RCPEEQLAYCLRGNRLGCLLIQGTKVQADKRVRPPLVPADEPLQMYVTCLAAWGRTAVVGDAEGQL